MPKLANSNKSNAILKFDFISDIFCFHSIKVMMFYIVAVFASHPVQGAIQNFEYVSNGALSSGAICLKTLPFVVYLSVMLCFFMTFGCREAGILR